MTQNDPTDLELVRRCRDDYPYATGAFEMLMGRHERSVFRYCLHYLRHEQNAEDAAQEVFTRAFFNIQKFEGRSAFKTWLLRIAQNTCARHYGRERKSRQGPPLWTGQPDAPSESEPTEVPLHAQMPTDREEQASLVIAAMAEQDRQVLLLRHVSELSLEEVAEVLEVSLSAAKMRLYRAEEKFRNEYLRLNEQPLQSIMPLTTIFSCLDVTFGSHIGI